MNLDFFLTFLEDMSPSEDSGMFLLRYVEFCLGFQSNLDPLFACFVNYAQ